jgi:hypothetical protein|nr:MAG TPA: hypothetical protein [Caudoviricetes sp.]
MAWSEMSYNRNFFDDTLDEDTIRHKKSLSESYTLRLQKRQEMESKRQERLKKKYKGEQQ